MTADALTKGPIAPSYHLRIEAGPHKYEELFASEKAAIEAVLALLLEAIELVGHGDKHGHGCGRAGYVIDVVRASRIAFLSGRRGSGKSTVLLSLMHMLDRGSEPKDTSELARRVDKLRDRIVLLEPLDMEPLAEGANLLEAILQRIEVATFNMMPPPGCTDRPRPSDPLATSLQKLRALQQDVGMAWGGNLLQRGSALDPEAYAIDVARAEHARLGINARLAEALDALARMLTETSKYKDPIFLLPVDDFDLNPLRCVELLQLLRMVSVPRLFAVICGDVEVARSITQMRICGDMNRMVEERATGNEPTVAPQEIKALASQLTSNALRKLLPPGQRIELKPLTIKEALDGIQSRDKQSLRDILRAIRIDRPGGQPEHPATLGEMLEHEDYTARQVLATYPRHATDLLHLAQRKPDEMRWALELVHKAALMALAEEGGTREREAMTRTDAGKYTLRSSYFAASAQGGRGRNVLESHTAVAPLKPRAIMAYEHREWQVYVERQGRGKVTIDRGAPIGESATLWIILYHDLCYLSQKGQILGDSLVPEQLRLITTEWEDAGGVSWPHPHWPTFYETDRFIARVRDKLTARSYSSAEPLAISWIKAILAGQATNTDDHGDHFPGGDELARQCREGPEPVRRWIEHLPVWLAPECGVPSDLASELLRNEDLVASWERHAPRIRKLRSDNLDQYVDSPRLVHQLGARPQELDDLLRDAKLVLANTSVQLPLAVRNAADIAKIRDAVKEHGAKRLLPKMVPLPVIEDRLGELEEAEETAALHPINAFRHGLFRPTPFDGLVTDYQSTFYRKQDEGEDDHQDDDEDND